MFLNNKNRRIVRRVGGVYTSNFQKNYSFVVCRNETTNACMISVICVRIKQF